MQDKEEQAALDIFEYAPKDIKPLLLLAVRPSDLSNVCKTNRQIRNICGSVDFLTKYLERWHNIEGDEKDSLVEIIFEIRPKKMMEICSYHPIPSFCNEEILRSYANALEEKNPDDNLRTMFSEALNNGYVDRLEALANMYDPYWGGDPENEIKTFVLSAVNGDQEVFEIISKGRFTQTFFEKAIEWLDEYEDEGLNTVIFNAAKNGDIAYVKVLLKERRIDPSKGINRKAIIEAVKREDEEMVKLLAPFVQPDVKKKAIREAIKREDEEMVEILGVTPTSTPAEKHVISHMEEAAERYVKKLGEYHREFRGKN